MYILYTKLTYMISFCIQILYPFCIVILYTYFVYIFCIQNMSRGGFPDGSGGPPGKCCARPINRMGESPRAVSNQRKGSRFPARPLNQPRGFEPGTSFFRGGRFAHCATWTPYTHWLSAATTPSVVTHFNGRNIVFYVYKTLPQAIPNF